MKINGVPVVDAKKPLLIKVTAKDVENGNRKDPGGCAMALAAKRALHAKEARVHVGRTYVKVENSNGKEEWIRFKTSGALRTELVSFDRGQQFLEGEYRISPMPPSDKLESKRPGGRHYTGKRKERPRKLRVARKRYHITSGIRAHGANR